MFKAQQMHVGQYKPYGDFFREWFIETDLPEEEALEKCFTLERARKVPERSEWRANICVGGAHHRDANYYFSGYYMFKKIAGGYRFTIGEPYAD